MKIPKVRNRHCKYCNKHTSHKVGQSKGKGRSKSTPMSRMGGSRIRKRGLRRGVGNKGRYSKPAIKNWKLTGRKQSKKTDLRYECSECKKKSVQASGKRAKKVEFI